MPRRCITKGCKAELTKPKMRYCSLCWTKMNMLETKVDIILWNYYMGEDNAG
jgi:hypothetical protein